MKQKQLLVPLAVLAAVALVVLTSVHPLVRSPADLLVGAHRDGRNDLSTSFVAYHAYPAYALWQYNQLPAWNPLKYSGAPFHGNPESGVFYPPNWLVWVTRDAALLGWIVVLHLVVGGLGAYRLCRGYGLRPAAACTGAVIYAAAPFLLVQASEGHYTLVCAAAWAPWAFWALERLRDGAVYAFFLLAGVLVGCFFAGHAQTTYYLVAILTFMRIADIVGLYRAGRRQAALNAAGQWILLGLAVAGLAAVDLVPIWAYAKYTIRGRGLGWAQAGAIHIGFANLAQLFYPYALGDSETYRGPGKYFWETLCYFGVVPLLLALLGVVARHRRTFVRRWGVVAAASLLFSAGTIGGLFPLCYFLLPGGAMFQAPSRMLLYATLAVAVLAATGVQYAAQLVRVRRRRVAATPKPTLGVVGMIAVVAIHPRLRVPVATLLTAACGLELALFGSGLFAVMPREKLQETTPIVAFLQKQKALGRVSAPQALLTDYEAWRSGIEKVQAFDPAPPALHASLAMQTADGEADAVMRRELFGFPAPRSERDQTLWLDLMNVRFVVLPATVRPPDESWRLVDRGRVVPRFADEAAAGKAVAYAIYERRHPLPRAFVLGEVESAGSMKEAVARLAALEPRSRILLEQDVLPSGQRQPFTAARIVEHTPNRVVVEATLDKPGYLYLGDAWLPGWTAEDAGQSLPVLRANTAFRAVPLGAGRHRVTFHYAPGGLAIGCWLSLVSLAGCLTWALTRGAKRLLRPAEERTTAVAAACRDC